MEKDILIHEYVGDLSQELLECSYNEDEIRWLWNNGTLRDQYDRISSSCPARIKGLSEMYGIANSQECQDLMTQLVKKYNGWPVDYDSVNLGALTEQEVNKLK